MIYDIDDNPIFAFPLSIRSNETKTLTIRLECRTGYFLRSENVSGLNVSACLADGISPYQDIENTPLDLSPWNGTRQNFFVRLAADVAAARARRNFNLTVSL